jgi:26S proteasome regulatory subunit N7
MGDPQFAKYPHLQLSQHIFHISNPESTRAVKQASLRALQDAITENKMAPLYRHLAHPTEGVMNVAGEGTADHSEGHALRRTSSSAATLLASRRPSLDVPISWDEQLYERMKADNEKELEAIQKEEDEATEKAGETEIQAARGKRAEFLTRIGEKVSICWVCPPLWC